VQEIFTQGDKGILSLRKKLKTTQSRESYGLFYTWRT
jgi:hypothetical protein